jgi:hypothetical protein
VSGLEANAERIGSDVLQYTYAGCPPVLSYFSVARPNCAPFNARALDLVGEAGIQSVVLAARWSDYGPEVRDGLQATVDALLARGVAVHVIGQSPQFVAPVQTIAFQAARRGVEGDAWPARVDPALNEEVRAHARGASFVDPMALLCEGRACPFRDAGEFHFFDYGHFSTRGASRALAAYVPQGLRPPS